MTASDIGQLTDELKGRYGPIFTENFLDFIIRSKGKSGHEEEMQFALSCYNVALAIDYMFQRKTAAEKKSPEYLRIRNLRLEDVVEITSSDIRPDRKLTQLGFTPVHKTILANLLNEKLEIDLSTHEHQVYSIEMRRIRTVGDCINLFYRKYKALIARNISSDE